MCVAYEYSIGVRMHVGLIICSTDVVLHYAVLSYAVLWSCSLVVDLIHGVLSTCRVIYGRIRGVGISIRASSVSGILLRSIGFA